MTPQQFRVICEAREIICKLADSTSEWRILNKLDAIIANHMAEQDCWDNHIVEECDA